MYKRQLLFIPEKLEIDWDNLEISNSKEASYYVKGKIIEDQEKINLAKYNKTNIEKDGIIITTDLILESKITFKESHIEGEENE